MLGFNPPPAAQLKQPPRQTPARTEKSAHVGSDRIGAGRCPPTLKEQDREAERMARENLNLKICVQQLEMFGDRGDLECRTKAEQGERQLLE